MRKVSLWIIVVWLWALPLWANEQAEADADSRRIASEHKSEQRDAIVPLENQRAILVHQVQKLRPSGSLTHSVSVVMHSDSHLSYWIELDRVLHQSDSVPDKFVLSDLDFKGLSINSELIATSTASVESSQKEGHNQVHQQVRIPIDKATFDKLGNASSYTVQVNAGDFMPRELRLSRVDARKFSNDMNQMRENRRLHEESHW
jgi:hypothetical protein